MKRRGFQLQDFNVDSHLALMEIYQSEWQYIHGHLWNLIFKFFYANLIVLFLPNLSTMLGINLSKFPPVLFPSISSILSLVFLYVTFGVTKRVEASAKTYAHMLQMLPENLQRIPVASPQIKMGRFFRFPLNQILCVAMFLSLFFASIVMIFYNLSM